MRVVKLSPWLVGLALLAGPGAQAQADVTSDQSGSIVVFPKVIADGTRDTLIQLTNTSNSTVYVECVYVNGAGVCDNAPQTVCQIGSNDTTQCPGGDCVPIDGEWRGEDFGPLVLTRQQPTIWRVSTGRLLNPNDGTSDGVCTNVGPGTPQDCPGIDPGTTIPAQGPIFQGELKCVQVDASSAPIPGNALKGEAIIETLNSTQISKYNSINIIAESPNADPALDLDGTEYNACPAALEFSHLSDDASDPVAEVVDVLACGGGACTVDTEITVIPCTQDFEGGLPSVVPVTVLTVDEFESQLSAAFTLECWANLDLEDIATGIFDQNTFRKTRLFSSGSNVCRSGTNRGVCVGGGNAGNNCDENSDCSNGRCRQRICTTNADCGAGGVCGPPSGILAVAEAFHIRPGQTAAGSAAQNVHMIGERVGACAGNLATPCDEDSDCGLGGQCLIDTITFHSLP